MKYKNLFRKLAKSKKGFDDDFTDIIIGIIFIAIIFIVVFVYITNTQIRIEKAIEKESNNLEKDYILLSYLRTPIEGEKTTIAEYLGYKEKRELINSKYGIVGINAFCGVKDMSSSGIIPGLTEDGLLVKETNKILEDINDWSMSMYINKENEFCSIEKGRGTNKESVEITGETAKAVIPSIYQDFNIEIYFKLNIFGFSSLSSI